MNPQPLEGMFDLYVHAARDVRPRKLDAWALAAAASAAGMGGFVLKRHVAPTAAEAAVLRGAYPRPHANGVVDWGGLCARIRAVGVRLVRAGHGSRATR